MTHRNAALPVMMMYRGNQKKDSPISPLLLGISPPFLDMLYTTWISIERNKNEVDWVYIDGAIVSSILTVGSLKSI